MKPGDVEIHNPQSAVGNPPWIDLHIEELGLHGFSPGDRSLIGEALERELLRLFGGRGLPFSVNGDGEFARLDGGTFEVAPGSKPETIGLQIARAVHRGLIK